MTKADMASSYQPN